MARYVNPVPTINLTQHLSPTKFQLAKATSVKALKRIFKDGVVPKKLPKRQKVAKPEPIEAPGEKIEITPGFETVKWPEKDLENTGVAIYTGVNDYYQPLREVLHPFMPFYAS